MVLTVTAVAIDAAAAAEVEDAATYLDAEAVQLAAVTAQTEKNRRAQAAGIGVTPGGLTAGRGMTKKQRVRRPSPAMATAASKLLRDERMRFVKAGAAPTTEERQALAATALRDASEEGLELELGYAMWKGRPTQCKYKGVKLCEGRGHDRCPWQARVGSPAVALGTFETAEQAALHRARYLRDQRGGMQPGEAPKRRSAGAVPDEDKQYACTFPGCSKRYMSQGAANLHVRKTHPMHATGIQGGIDQGTDTLQFVDALNEPGEGSSSAAPVVPTIGAGGGGGGGARAKRTKRKTSSSDEDDDDADDDSAPMEGGLAQNRARRASALSMRWQVDDDSDADADDGVDDDDDGNHDEDGNIDGDAYQC